MKKTFQIIIVITFLFSCKKQEQNQEKQEQNQEVEQTTNADLIDPKKHPELYEKSDSGHYQSGLNKMSLEDYYGAIEDFNKAILLNPNYSMAYLHRGECKFFLDDGSCYGDFNKCLEIDSKNAECYYYRGLTLIDSGQKKEGCLDLSKAGELGDEDAYEAIRKYCND